MTITDLVDTDEYTDPADDIEDLIDVDRHLAHIRRLTRERNDLLAVYEAEIERLNVIAADIHERYERRIAWHRTPVESWHRAHTSKRTLELPSGTIKLQVPTTPKAWIDDAATVTEWARQSHPEILKAPNVSDVRKVVELVETETGWHALDPSTSELVPGLKVEVPNATWSYQVADGDIPGDF